MSKRRQTKFEITGEVGEPVGSQFLLILKSAIAEAKLISKLKGADKKTSLTILPFIDGKNRNMSAFITNDLPQCGFALDNIEYFGL